MSTRTALLAVLLVTAGARPAPALDLEGALREARGSGVRGPSCRGRHGHAGALPAREDGRIAPPPDELVARALQRAPSLAALAARVQEAREMVRPAGALPDPMVELMVQDIGFPRWTVGEEDMSMIGPQITQGIPFPGKRGARRQAAQAEVTVKASELELLRREVARDIRVALRPALRARPGTAGAGLRARAARDAGRHGAGALQRGRGRAGSRGQGAARRVAAGGAAGRPRRGAQGARGLREPATWTSRATHRSDA